MSADLRFKCIEAGKVHIRNSAYVKPYCDNDFNKLSKQNIKILKKYKKKIKLKILFYAILARF
jgi:hypothetical protein